MPTPVELRGDPILKRLPRQAVVVEVGVLTGTLSEYLLRRRPALHLVAVDNWATLQEQPPRYVATKDSNANKTARECELSRLSAERKLYKYENRVTLLALESSLAAKRVKDHSCDLVFIDGDHSFEGVCADLKAWEPKIRPGGFLSGHDYGNTTSSFDLSGVKAAVDLWRGERGIELDSDYTWFVRL